MKRELSQEEVNGISFADERTAPWKEGWIETDINLGVHGLEEL
jgi:hypothetical protein